MIACSRPVAESHTQLLFVTEAKMRLRQVSENQIRFDIYLGVTSPCEVTVNLQRSEVNSGVGVTFNYILTSNTKSRSLTSCIFIVTSRSHTCPDIDLWPHAHSSSSNRMASSPQINFKAVLLLMDTAKLHFCLAHKNSNRVIIDCYTPEILQLVEDKTFRYNWSSNLAIIQRSLRAEFLLKQKQKHYFCY